MQQYNSFLKCSTVDYIWYLRQVGISSHHHLHLVFDIKRNGCVEITKQHPKNLRVDVSDQYFAILVHRKETIITYECFWPIKRVYFLLFCVYI